MGVQTVVERAAVLPAERLTQLTEVARAVWASGDFARIGARTVLVGEVLCRSLDIHPGERVLDVAAGSGNTAISAARRGARVTASDFVASLLEVAQARAEVEALPLATAVADAQELPFEDASFDVVLSTFGAMFAPDQQRAADELVRVCRSGGHIGMANWTPEGLIGEYMAVSNRHVPPPPAAAGLRRPSEWGTEQRLREVFGERVSEISTARRAVDLCADSAAEYGELNRTWLGPTRTAFAQLDEEGQARFAADLAAEPNGSTGPPTAPSWRRPSSSRPSRYGNERECPDRGDGSAPRRHAGRGGRSRGPPRRFSASGASRSATCNAPRSR